MLSGSHWVIQYDDAARSAHTHTHTHQTRQIKQTNKIEMIALYVWVCMGNYYKWIMKNKIKKKRGSSRNARSIHAWSLILYEGACLINVQYCSISWRIYPVHNIDCDKMHWKCSPNMRLSSLPDRLASHSPKGTSMQLDYPYIPLYFSVLQSPLKILPSSCVL